MYSYSYIFLIGCTSILQLHSREHFRHMVVENAGAIVSKKKNANGVNVRFKWINGKFYSYRMLAFITGTFIRGNNKPMYLLGKLQKGFIFVEGL